MPQNPLFLAQSRNIRGVIVPSYAAYSLYTQNAELATIHCVQVETPMSINTVRVVL